jgi:hypothetical protein
MCVFLFSPGIAFAQYTPEELCVIEWGNDPHQLKIDMPVWVDLNNTPADPTDDLIEEDGGGPTQAFVDMYENVYISSYGLGYFKAFDSSGRLILNFSPGEPDYDSLFGGHTISKFYVDSLCQIYLLAFPPLDYIVVVDTLGNLLDKLSPLGLNPPFGVCAMYFNSGDNLSVCSCNRELYTYENGNFTPGGAMGWRAFDGYYYNAGPEDSTQIRFIRYSDPGLDGYSTDLLETFVPYNPYFFSVGILGVDDSLRIFVGMLDSESNSRIQIYNTAYELLDEIVYTPSSNRYFKYIGSFMRADGTLYEFRCLDDGMHVFRWSKK